MTRTTAAPVQREAMDVAVSRFFHMSNSHCPGNVAPLLTADVEFQADENASGQDAVNAYFVRLWEAYPELTFRVENMIADEHGAAAEVSYTGGPGGNGQRCFVFQFRGDHIRRIRCY